MDNKKKLSQTTNNIYMHNLKTKKDVGYFCKFGNYYE